MTWKTGTLLALVAFAMTLAYHIVTRLSTEAMNVAVGVLCGMFASLPVSFGLLVALTRKRDQTGEEEPRSEAQPAVAQSISRPQTPQIIVVAPPQMQPYAQGQAPYIFPNAGAPNQNYWSPQHEEIVEGRDWKIIGDDA